MVRWSDNDGAIEHRFIPIVPSYHPHRVIAPSLSHCRTFASSPSHHRYRTVVPSRHRHRTIVIILSYNRVIAIVPSLSHCCTFASSPSHHRYRTVVPSCHRHRTTVSSLHRPKHDGAMVRILIRIPKKSLIYQTMTFILYRWPSFLFWKQRLSSFLLEWTDRNTFSGKMNLSSIRISNGLSNLYTPIYITKRNQIIVLIMLHMCDIHE